MSAETQDVSVSDSVPIEAFEFIAPTKTYRYNDSDDEITIEGQIYAPLASISRGVIEVGTTLGNQGVVEILVPFNTEVAIDHGFLLSPAFLNVNIYRLELGTDYDTEKKKIWTGRANNFSTRDLMLNIVTQSVISGARTLQLLSAYWQRMCNFDLYDADTCKLTRSLFTETSTVTVVGNTAITVVDDGFADHELPIGEVVNTRTGEKRLIIDNLVNVIELAYGFTDIIVGDTVTITKGCAHTSTACNGFSNIINYGGFRYIPPKSPLTS